MQYYFFYFEDEQIFKFGLPLNLGGPLIFHYDEIEEELTISENPYFINGFFSVDASEKYSSVNNVTAIIGENGAGKSSALALIKSVLTEGHHGIRIPAIIALTNQEGRNYVYYTQSLQIRKGNYKQFGFELYELKVIEKQVSSEAGLHFDTLEFPELAESRALDIVYFSNIFDGTYEYEFKGSRNISTNYLVKNDLNLFREFNPHVQNQKTGEIGQYIIEEVNRQVDFVNNFDDEKVIPFEIPDTLLVSLRIDYLGILAANPMLTKDSFEFQTEELRNQIERLFRSSVNTQPADVKQQIEYRFLVSCFFHFLFEFQDMFRVSAGRAKLYYDELANKNDNVVNIKDFLAMLINTISFEFQSNELVKACAKGVLDFFEELSGFIKDGDTSYRETNSFYINIKDKGVFKKFYRLYANSFLQSPFLNFSWRNLSSGEKALFNLYSRFFSLSDKLQWSSNSSLENNVLVLIDEGDLYLHPAWQKQFVLLLLKFLPVAYAKQNGKRNIQVVLTSNNPLVVSDLPNSSIIFLKKDNNGISVKNSLEDKKLTFAANIHTLFADSFFLNSGLVGDFAKAKINEVIDLLQGSRERIEERRDYIEKVISFIGEPLIKTKLTQMFSERLQLSMVDLHQRVAFLERQMDEIKKAK